MLPAQPDFRIRTAGFRESEIRAMELMIELAVVSLTGQPFRGVITHVEEETPRDGSVLILEDSDELADDICGRALTGAWAGRIRLNMRKMRSEPRACNFDSVFPHEVGHALGFSHVSEPLHLMYSPSSETGLTFFSSSEWYHGALAYQLGRGAPYGSLDTMTTEARRELTTLSANIGETPTPAENTDEGGGGAR